MVILYVLITFVNNMDPATFSSLLLLKACLIGGLYIFGLRGQTGSASSSNSAQHAENSRVADLQYSQWQAGTYQADPDERARVQAYFAELDRRRAAANN